MQACPGGDFIHGRLGEGFLLGGEFKHRGVSPFFVDRRNHSYHIYVIGEDRKSVV